MRIVSDLRNDILAALEKYVKQESMKRLLMIMHVYLKQRISANKPITKTTLDEIEFSNFFFIIIGLLLLVIILINKKKRNCNYLAKYSGG